MNTNANGIVNGLIALGSVLVGGLLIVLVTTQMTISKASFQSPQFVLDNVRFASGDDRWVDLRTALADMKAKTWVAEAPDTTLKNDERIRFDVLAHKDSCVYLLYKGTWSKAASLIFPSTEDRTNALKERQTLHTSAFCVQPPAGKETVLVVAAPGPVTWLKDPSLADSFYRCANRILNVAHSSDGLLVLVARTAEAGSKTPAPAGSTELFITQVSISHF